MGRGGHGCEGIAKGIVEQSCHFKIEAGLPGASPEAEPAAGIDAKVLAFTPGRQQEARPILVTAGKGGRAARIAEFRVVIGAVEHQRTGAVDHGGTC